MAPRQVDISSSYVSNTSNQTITSSATFIDQLEIQLMKSSLEIEEFLYIKKNALSPCPIAVEAEYENLRYVPIAQGLNLYAIVIVVNSKLNKVQSDMLNLSPFILAMVSLFKSQQHQQRLNTFSEQSSNKSVSTLLNSLLENAFQPVLLFDDSLKVIKSNSSAQELFNSNLKRGWQPIDELLPIFVPDIAENLLGAVKKVTYLGQLDKHQWRDIKFYFNPYHSAQVDINLFESSYHNARCYGVVIKIRDTVEGSETDHLSLMQRFNALSNVIPMAILQLDSKFDCIYANTFWTHYTGQSLDETLTLGWKKGLASENTDVLLSTIIKSTKSSNHYHGEISLANAETDQLVETEINAVGLFNEKYEATGMILTFKDISESKDYARKLESMSQIDFLTGLTNRTFFADRLNVALSRTNRHGKAVLMLIDLDKFKHVNDSYGHNAGDAVLQEAAKRISQCVREEDCIARLGGDEFAVVISDLKNAAIINTIANNIVERLSRPIVYNGIPFYISCSIGVSVTPKSDITQEEFVKQADLALYSAKDAGRSQWCFYDEQLESNAYLITQLKHSLNQPHKHEFTYFMQPIINVDTGEYISGELLCRWQNEQNPDTEPDKFVKLIEESGLVNNFFDWQISELINISLRWLELDFINERFSISFNLSALLIGTKGFGTELVQKFTDNYLNPKMFSIEVTETSFINNPDVALANLKVIKKAGFTVALDDFGTGFSSLSHLRRMPIDIIKIDTDFVKDVYTDNNSAEIVKAMIEMAEALNIKVIAEGVESKEVSSWLSKHKCAVQQGFLFSQPINIEECEKSLFKPKVVAIK